MGNMMVNEVKAKNSNVVHLPTLSFDIHVTHDNVIIHRGQL